MITFKPVKPVIAKSIFKEFVFEMIVLSLVWLIGIFLNMKTIVSIFPFVYVVVFVLSVGKFINIKRVKQLSIDVDKKEIRCDHKSIITGLQTKVLSFEGAGLKILAASPGLLKMRDPLKLRFFKNKWEVFELSVEKDGFTIETLQAIGQQVEQLALPVTRK
jgi:hypothetical protein